MNTTHSFLKTEKVIVDWFIIMAKIKDELFIKPRILPYKVLSMYYVSDIVLGIEHKMMNRNEVPTLMELIFQ